MLASLMSLPKVMWANPQNTEDGRCPSDDTCEVTHPAIPDVCHAEALGRLHFG
ncbi:UNVERIFIED_CONTAM: hypothetical protein FKN15_001019 [Acipenser sinensis]